MAALITTVGIGFVSLLLAISAPAAFAAQPPVGLGTAKSYAILGGSTVTNTGASVISGDIGLSPGEAVEGFPPGIQATGTTQVANGPADQAKDDLVTAYNDAAGRTPVTNVAANLGGRTLSAGVYKASSAMGLTGTLTLDGGPNDVFIFQAGSTLITASNAVVALTGGARACNVFWQVGSSATLGTDTRFVGTVMALTSATLNTRATVRGRILARNGAVTLDTNTITVPNCAAVGPSDSPSSTATANPGGPGGPGSGGNGSGGNGSGGNGSGGNGSGSDSISVTTVPSGHPETGEGGAGGGLDNLLFLGGGLALSGAAFASTRALRRPYASRPSHR